MIITVFFVFGDTEQGCKKITTALFSQLETNL